jgi:hypothetical protein
MENRILALNDFKAKSDAKQAQQAAENEGRTVREIVQLAVEIHRRLMPGASVLIDVKSGKIVVPGKAAGNQEGCIFISKPAAMIRTTAQIDLATGGDLPAPENPPKVGEG